MLLNWCIGEDSWESLGLHRDPTSPSSRKSVLNIHWNDWCWSRNSNILATWCEELTHWKIPWCWERLKVGGEGDNRGWDGWMASPTQWTRVWVNPRSWWWTGRPGVLQCMGSQSRARLRGWIELQLLSSCSTREAPYAATRESQHSQKNSVAMHQPTGARLYWPQDFSPHPKPTPSHQSHPRLPPILLCLGCLLWESIALFTKISGSPSEHGRIPFPCPLEVRCEQVPCLGNDMWPSLVSTIDWTFVLVSFSQCQRRASISPVSRWSQRQSVLPICKEHLTHENLCCLKPLKPWSCYHYVTQPTQIQVLFTCLFHLIVPISFLFQPKPSGDIFFL